MPPKTMAKRIKKMEKTTTFKILAYKFISTYFHPLLLNTAYLYIQFLQHGPTDYRHNRAK
jgi:hypothetical protein